MINKGLTLLTGLLILFSCRGQDSRIAINKTKKGGLFEINENGKSLTFYNKKESMKVDTTTFVPFAEFDNLKEMESPYEGMFILDFKLNETGTLKFEEMTSRNLGKQLCFVIDDKIIAAPIINAEIPNGRIQMLLPDKEEIELIIKYLKN
jgi:preprotein translocase subunit SecD